MIRVLPETLVNKIAAGEVIVRPASVVKELVENSLDAGATRIRVEAANACRDLVVADDGIGMTRADAELALVRHATSKIENFDDLYKLGTRGFRGEALASIAAVSRIQILTRRRGEVAGVRIAAEGESEPRIEPAGAPEGTDIRVRELFFNTPARLKFMKSPGGELQALLTIVTRQALIRPDIGFTVLNEGTVLFDLPPMQPWPERIAALLGGPQIYDNLLDVDETRHDVRVHGYVLRPLVSRKDRRHQYFHVNGRPISSRSMSASLQETYKGIIMVGRFPICVLDVELATDEVDVNVHPTKEEVRFRNESLVNGVIYKTVQNRLRSANLVPTASLEAGLESGERSAFSVPGHPGSRLDGTLPADSSIFQSSSPLSPHPSTLSPHSSPLSAERSALNAGNTTLSQQELLGSSPFDFSAYTAGVHNPQLPPRSVAQVAATEREMNRLFRGGEEPPDEGWRYVGQEAPEGSEPAGGGNEQAEGRDCSVRPVGLSLRRVEESVEPAPRPGAEGRPDLDGTPWAFLLRGGMLPEPIGQVARCYILAAAGDDLLLIDQHAAHERLMYLHFAKQQKEVPSQPLLIPISVDVAAPAVAYMERLLPVFTTLGLKVEPFGGTTYLVQSVPADLAGRMDPGSVLADLLDDFETLGRVEQVDVLRDRVITRMACRAAVKAGQSLHLNEMRALIRDLAEARLGFTCPHGRPTMVLLTRHQLDKLFKRVV